MKKVIALWGSANVGKSSNLKKVHKKLARVAGDTVPEAHRDGGDLREIFVVNGFKVGIETQGDPGGRLAKSLRLFQKHRCDVIICGTRSRGSTVDLVENLKPAYHLSWRGQSDVSESDLQEQSNEAIAELIFQECLAALV